VIAVNRDKDQLYRVMTLLNSLNSSLLNNDAQACLLLHATLAQCS
jgi:hypothetical protein